MIFKAKNAEGFYKIAMIKEDDGEGGFTETWWTLPETQTIKWGTDGGLDIFLWPSYPKDQVERFLSCAEFVAKNKAHMLARDLEVARKCIVVTDTDGNTSTLDEYIKDGKDPAMIVDAPDLADYYRAEP